MKALGLDLAGASGVKTGFAVVEGEGVARLLDAGSMPRAKSPAAAEAALLDLIDEAGPDVLAIDAPLTLPPCLTCPGYCRGPDPDLCELQAAREMWTAGSNPVSRRPCEVKARELIPGLDPKPTMGLGIITARAVALVRKLEVRGRPPSSLVRGEVLEVYPAASLHRLGQKTAKLRPKERGENETSFCARAVEGFEALGLAGLDEHRETVAANRDVLDAVVSAYTGWLYPDGLEPPPEDFNVASGWIWFPKAA